MITKMKIIAIQHLMINHCFNVKEELSISIKLERKFKMICPEPWIKYLGQITTKEYVRIMVVNLS